MKYQVQYENQDWIPSDIEAASPLEAAQLYLAQDSDGRYADYDEVVVFCGGFGKQPESFLIHDLLAFKNEGDGTRPPGADEVSLGVDAKAVSQEAAAGNAPSTQDSPKLCKPMLLLLATLLSFGLAYHVRYSGEGMTFQNSKGGGALTLDDTVAFFRGLEDQRFYKKASADLRNRRVGSGLLVLTGFACMVQAARCYRKLRSSTSPIQLFRS